MRLTLTSRDLKFVLAATVALLVIAVAGWIFRRAITQLLSPEEWRVLLKLQALVALLYLLMLSDIALTSPPEMFIYGRF